MHEIIMSIFFITGTSGSGKSTIMEHLKEQLPASHFVLHDFDEVGVPDNADQAWRIATTQYWIEKAQQYAAQNKATVICGVTVPSEVMEIVQGTALQPFFALLKIDDATITQRLQERGWSEQLIQDNINWAHALESQVRATKQHLMLETSNYGKPTDIAHQLIAWINNLEHEVKHMSHKSIPKEMDLPELLALLTLFENHGITVIVDGGWGVDALLEKQTRPHGDLDIAVDHRQVPLLRTLLEARGYKDVPRDDTRECNFVLGDDKGHEVDVHSFIFDEQGNITFGVPYPLESLQGTGHIGGRSVQCIPPDWMIQFHTGYALDENDYHDVLALCQKFNLPLPKEYKHLFD